MSVKSIADRKQITNRRRLDNDIILTFLNGLKIVVSLKDWNLNSVNAKIKAII